MIELSDKTISAADVTCSFINVQVYALAFQYCKNQLHTMNETGDIRENLSSPHLPESVRSGVRRASGVI